MKRPTIHHRNRNNASSEQDSRRRGYAVLLRPLVQRHKHGAHRAKRHRLNRVPADATEHNQQSEELGRCKPPHVPRMRNVLRALQDLLDFPPDQDYIIFEFDFSYAFATDDRDHRRRDAERLRGHRLPRPGPHHAGPAPGRVPAAVHERRLLPAGLLGADPHEGAGAADEDEV